MFAISPHDQHNTKIGS